MLSNSLIRKIIYLFLTHIKRLGDALLPPLCLLCGLASANRENICAPCQQSLPSLPEHCQQCAQFLPISSKINTILCGQCLINPPPFDRTYALFAYEWPVTAMIIRLKFQNQLSHAKAFSDLLLTSVTTHWYQRQPLPDLILPMPLHLSRLKERGFNQTLAIAKPLARALAIPLDTTGISRIKATAPQTSLTANKRIKNMDKAFIAHRRYDGLCVAVVDDVITTGQTMRACCEILRQQGATSIHVWAVARCS